MKQMRLWKRIVALFLIGILVMGTMMFDVYAEEENSQNPTIGNTSDDTRNTESDTESEASKETEETSESESESEAEPVRLSLETLADLATSVTSNSQLKLTWTPVANAKEYTISRKAGDGSYKKLASVTEGTYLDENVSKEVLYTYKVTAVPAASDSSELVYTASVTYTTGTVTYKLSAPKLNTLVRTSSGSIRLSWNKVSHATYYEIYRSTKKSSGYTKIATTSKTSYTNKSGKALKKYYYKVKARYYSVAKKYVRSSYSNIRSAKVRKKAEKIAYVGDSIMTGYTVYNIISNTKAHKVLAKIGMQTSTFYNGNYMDQLLNYNPDRMYIMLGMNCLGGSVNTNYETKIIKYYRYILEECLAENPHMEIIVIGVSPVTRNAKISLKAVNHYNASLKAMLKKYFADDDVHYLSIASVLADSSGYMKPALSAGDGIHWKKATYQDVLTRMKEFAKEF